MRPGTSSASTKLIHGGLRYLEHGWLRLVREALIEREVLLRMAPHLIRPMRFVLPVEPGMRPRWMLRLGLFVYDHLGGRKLLPATRTIDLAHDPLGAPLKGRYEHGFEYSDCWVDDARLVVLNAVDAAARGAVIRTRTRCVRVERGADWKLVLEVRGRRDVMSARALVNATGPWVGTFSETVLRRPPSGNVRLIAGSHIVVPRLFEHDRAYIFQAPDGRVVFALPFEGDFTMVGTTDRDFSGDPGQDRSERRGDRLSLQDRERSFPHAGDGGRRGLVVRRRAPALWRGRRQAAGHRRATMCWSSIAWPAKRRC